jgi:hypothetical protein
MSLNIFSLMFDLLLMQWDSTPLEIALQNQNWIAANLLLTFSEKIEPPKLSIEDASHIPVEIHQLLVPSLPFSHSQRVYRIGLIGCNIVGIG